MSESTEEGASGAPGAAAGGGLRGLWRRIAGAKEAPLAPPSGLIARLVIFVAAAMGFLAVVAAGFGLAADRLADQWAGDLARAATVRVSAPAARMDAALAVTLRALGSAPGIAGARALTDAEQQALLAPWLGPDAALEGLNPPRLIAVTLAGGDAPLDAAGINRRLTMELPEPEVSAIFDDHSRWRTPLLRAARGLRRLAWGAVLLSALSAAAMVTLAARATLAANRLVVETLRLLGATNDFIATAFVRRYTLRAAIGGALGAGAAALALRALPDLGDAAPGMAPGLTGAGWLALPLTPLILGLVAYAATRYAVLRALREAE